MNWIRKYLWVALTAARSNIAYAGDMTGRILFLGVILYIFLRLWKVTFDQTGAAQLGGLTITQMLWYLTVTESIVLSAPNVSLQVDEDVRTGALAMQLVRPMSYGLYRLATTFGERTVRFLVNLAAGSAVTLLIAGPMNIDLRGWLFLALALPLAFLLDFLGRFMVGLAAFWLEDTSGLLLIYLRGTMIIGGVLIPIELYPPAWQPLLKALPFANIAYGPAHLFVSPQWSDLGTVLLRQSLAALVLGAIVITIYRFALRRVFVNGG